MGVTANDGLRLKSITERESYHPSDYRKTTFTYENGQRFLTGGYFHYNIKMQSDVSTDPSEVGLLSTYVTPHHLVGGSNHGYGKVTVTARNTENQLLSKRELTFTNFSDATSGNQPRYLKVGGDKDYYTFPYTDKQYLKEWEMGLPLQTIEYDQNDHIVQKTENEYEFTLDSTSSQTKQVENLKVSRAKYTGAPVLVSNWGANQITVFQQLSYSDSYRPFTGRAFLKKTRTYTYYNDNEYVLDSTEFSYDDRHNIKTIITQLSDGSRMKTVNIYNYSVNAATGSTLYNMTLAGLEKQVGSERWKLGSVFTDNRLTDAGINTYDYTSGKLALKRLYALRIGEPLTYSMYTGYVSGPEPQAPYQNVELAFSGASLANFRKASEVLVRDDKNNPLETKLIDQDVYKAMIWDSLSGQKLAEAGSCHYSDIAYTSFETSLYGSNFSATLHSNVFDGGVSGGSMFKLWNVSTGANQLSGIQTLQAGKAYMLSFWIQGAAPAVTVGSTNIPLPTTPQYEKGNWKHYILHFTPATAGQLQLTGTADNSYLDEVRLHPVGATMQSQTYEPLFGISSSTDATGRITYYEYDALGRRSVVRDQDGHILSRTKNVVQGTE